VPHHQDSKQRPLAACRWWPEIRELIIDPTGSRAGRHLPTQPHKVTKLLATDDSTMWFHDDIPLAELRLVGPFNFTEVRIFRGPRNHVSKESFRIDDVYWNELERVGPSHDVDTSNIRQSPGIPRT
jgi:hypothetical protein